MATHSSDLTWKFSWTGTWLATVQKVEGEGTAKHAGTHSEAEQTELLSRERFTVGPCKETAGSCTRKPWASHSVSAKHF